MNLRLYELVLFQVHLYFSMIDVNDLFVRKSHNQPVDSSDGAAQLIGNFRAGVGNPYRKIGGILLAAFIVQKMQETHTVIQEEILTVKFSLGNQLENQHLSSDEQGVGIMPDPVQISACRYSQTREDSRVIRVTMREEVLVNNSKSPTISMAESSVKR